MSDTNVAKVSIAGKSEFKALQCEMPKIKLDTTHVNKVIIYFKSKMPLISIGIVQVFIPIGISNFHIIDIFTSFFSCSKNIDILGIYLNNIINQLICQESKNISIFCK